MDYHNIPEIPQTVEEYNECFYAFLKAVKEKDENLINLLISKEGILKRCFSKDKVTFLHVVAQQGTVQNAANICKLGTDINFPNSHGETPIFHAIRHSAEMVKILIDNGANVNVRCTNSISLLQETLFVGSEETVKIIVNAILNDKQNCTVESSDEIVKALLNNKSSLLEDRDCSLLVFFAAKIGNSNLFKLIVESFRTSSNLFQDIRTEDQVEGKKPRQEWDIKGLFDWTPLHLAVKQQLPEVVRFLLKAGANVNAMSLRQYTPLHYAAHLGNAEICEILLSFGAQVNFLLTDEFRNPNPLHLVCGRMKPRNSLDVENCYNYDEANHFGDVYMGLPLQDKPIFDLKVMKLLLKNNANPENQFHNEAVPLLGACYAGRLDAVKLLLEFGANIQACDYNGTSALHFAACSNSLEIVDFLLEKGLEIEMENYRGSTPLLIPIERDKKECIEMIEYLVDIGANINARNRNGATALMLASRFNMTGVVECLLALDADYKLTSEPRNWRRSLSRFPLQSSGDALDALIAFIALKEETLGDYIESYIEYFSDENSVEHNIFEECKLEITSMKSTKIVKDFRHSFYDFLTSNIYSAVKIVRNKEVRKVFSENKYKTEFPHYRYLLDKRFKRVITLEKVVGKTVDFFLNYGKFNLPILVVDVILSFLYTKDFRTFGRILCKRRS